MSLVAVPATLVLLGDKWLAAVPFVAAFALIGSLRVLIGPIPTLLLVMGHSKLQATNAWIEFSVFVVAAAVLVPRFGFIGLAYSRLVSAIAIMMVHLANGRLYAGMRIGLMAGAIWRPPVGVAPMATLLPLLASGERAPLLELDLQIAAGAAVYFGWIAPS
ncbi:MAG: polysaccharide biosynthesis C-terminal domain-containing protein [Burkholderiales bacterium]